MKKYSNLVVHASKDYDIDIDIVQDIYNNHFEIFYEKLEQYISNGRDL